MVPYAYNYKAIKKIRFIGRFHNSVHNSAAMEVACGHTGSVSTAASLQEGCTKCFIAIKLFSLFFLALD